MKDSQKIFNIRVTPHAKQNKVVENDGILRVYTTVAPENGRANNAVVELLAEYFDVPKSRITILKGLTGRNKVVTVD
ncbi:MAG: DUF167 domain-containing protein [Alphaproteobacteria bacterium]|nr:DUF167 domain-containing protein [Alphaproteobacteria bacterium]MBQ6011661.1 DUF167 domain-containing protein [Alphaproteobacteria bacterium]